MNAVTTALAALAVPGVPPTDENAFRPCPGPCNTTWRALSRAQRDDPAADVQPRAADPEWCARCAAEIRRALHELVTLHDALEDDKAVRTGPATEFVTGSSSPRSPSGEVDEQDALLRALEHVEDVIRYARKLPRREQTRRLLRAVGAAALSPLERTVRFLDEHLTWALAHEDIGRDTGQLVLGLRDRLAARTRTHGVVARLPEPCARCGLRSLVNVEGTEVVECQNLSCRAITGLREFNLTHEHRARHRRST